MTTEPSASTTSADSTWFVVNPYLRQCAPPEFSATLPPIVHTCWLLGSGAKYNPCGAAAAVMSRLVTPGSTTARRSTGSTSSTRFNRATLMTTPSATGSAPPERPVPAPRATNGTPCSAHTRTAAATCAASRGSSTSSGTTRYPVSPSHS